MFNFGLEVVETHLRILDPLEITCRAYAFFKNHDIGVNPLTTGKGHFWPTCFLTPRLSAWPLHKIQNVTNVKFKSLALVFNSKFDHKLFTSMKIT